jgi:hypothetical protein
MKTNVPLLIVQHTVSYLSKTPALENFPTSAQMMDPVADRVLSAVHRVFAHQVITCAQTIHVLQEMLSRPSATRYQPV